MPPAGSYNVAPQSFSGLRLAVVQSPNRASGHVGLTADDGDGSQDWTFVPLAGGVFKITPAGEAKLCLEAAMDERGDAGMAAYTGARSQKWRLVPSTAGNYAMVSVGARGYVLSVTSAGALLRLQLQKTGGEPSQLWGFNPTEMDPGTRYVPAGYHLTFQDNFDGDLLDKTKSSLYLTHNQTLQGNHEAERYEPDGVMVKDGVLALQARPAARTDLGLPYSSGAITANATFRHGYFEARIELPQGAGLWPAFWISGVEHWPSEWDIFEVPFDSGDIWQPVHTPKGQIARFISGANGGDNDYTSSLPPKALRIHSPVITSMACAGRRPI